IQARICREHTPSVEPLARPRPRARARTGHEVELRGLSRLRALELDFDALAQALVLVRALGDLVVTLRRERAAFEDLLDARLKLGRHRLRILARLHAGRPLLLQRDELEIDARELAHLLVAHAAVGRRGRTLGA